MNSCQKALYLVQWKSKWLIVCFSVLHNVQVSLSAIPARKRLELVGKIWWVMLY